MKICAYVQEQYAKANTNECQIQGNCRIKVIIDAVERVSYS